MDILDVLREFGLPVMMVLALGWYVNRQNKWIQNELQTELRESFTRLEGLKIKLIEQQKLMQINQAEIKARISTTIEVMSKLSGNGLGTTKKVNKF